ncbi:MAG: CYTH domain-containing protein, partial [Gemmatimonadota bacterium]|nr:CYTH domain-containing protein [Gemmatimonadota bacterium]
MTEERMRHFEAPSLDLLDRIAAAPLPGGDSPLEMDLFRDLYFDTPARELEHRGVIAHLRIRADGAAVLTVELRDRGVGPDGPVLRTARADLAAADAEAAFAGDSEPATLLRAITDPSRLAPVLELETTRRSRRIQGAMVHCDSVTIRGEGNVRELWEVELQLDADAAPDLADALAEEFGLEPVTAVPIVRART